jgi:hypothetical protein
MRLTSDQRERIVRIIRAQAGDSIAIGDIRSADLNLGDSRLRGTDPLAKLFLG